MAETFLQNPDSPSRFCGAHLFVQINSPFVLTLSLNYLYKPTIRPVLSLSLSLTFKHRILFGCLENKMEFYNRRLLLLSEDMPSSTISPLPLLQDSKPLPDTLANSSSPPTASTTSSSFASEYRTPLQMPPRPALDSNVAYTMLVLLTALFFLGFISIYIRRFSDDDSVSSRHRPHRNHPSTPLSWNYYSTSSCHKGADRATVLSLPVYTYPGGSEQLIDCAICLSEFEEGEKVKMIPNCRHVFHVECIDMWLFSHLSCPICRCTKLFPVAERGGDEGGSRVENGGKGRDGEVGSQSERRDSSSCCGSEDRRQVLRRTLSY